MPDQGHPAEHRGNQYGQSGTTNRNIVKKEIFQENGEDNRDHPVGSQGRIPHDLEHPLAGTVAEQPVGGVRNAIQMQAAGNQNQDNHRHDGPKLGTQQSVSHLEGDRGRQGSQQTDQRHPFHPLHKTLCRELNGHRDRIPGHELNHENERFHPVSLTGP